MRNLKIIGVNIFLEKRKTRLHVGILNRVDGKLVFTYDEHYFKTKNIFPLGPEFPLTQKQFISEQLFPSLEDRIPSLQNPAYPEYCLTMGVDPKERDPIILLSTIGRKGPSSFIFYPIYERKVTAEDVIKFRESLGLTTREFAAVFELSQSSLNALERDRILGNKILKQIEIILNFPNIALDFLLINGGYLVHEKWTKANNMLKAINPGLPRFGETEKRTAREGIKQAFKRFFYNFLGNEGVPGGIFSKQNLDPTDPKNFKSHYKNEALRTFELAKEKLKSDLLTLAPILEDKFAETAVNELLQRFLDINDIFEISLELRNETLKKVDAILEGHKKKE